MMTRTDELRALLREKARISSQLEALSEAEAEVRRTMTASPVFDRQSRLADKRRALEMYLKQLEGDIQGLQSDALDTTFADIRKLHPGRH